MNTYNATLLDEQLRAAGLDIYGCSSSGRVDWKISPTPAQLQKAQDVLAAHDSTALPTREARYETLRKKRLQGVSLSPAEIQQAIDLFLGV